MAGGTVKPVDDFVAELSRCLCGPAAWRRQVVAENLDGLRCEVESLTRYIEDEREAERRAVAEWGHPDALAEEFNRVAARARARCVARRILFGVPLLAVSWAAAILLSPVVRPWPSMPLQVSVGGRVIVLSLLLTVVSSVAVLVRSRGIRASIRSAPPSREVALACAGLLIASVVMFALVFYRAQVTRDALSWPVTGISVVLSVSLLGRTGLDVYQFARSGSLL